MKKTTLAVLAGSTMLALTACSGSDDDTGNAPPTEDSVAMPEDAPADQTADQGNSLTVGEDGANMQVNDGDTSVSANLGDDPSASVETR